MDNKTIVLPDDVLSKQICSVCHNYLNNGEVWLGKRGAIICGNCTQLYDNCDSVIAYSIYNVIAEYCIFKCNNHFNGCRAILKFNEFHHECNEKVYPCPKCSYVGSGSQLCWHFSNSHQDSIVNSIHLVFIPRPKQKEWFLFHDSNFLVGINVEHTTETSIKVNNVCSNPDLKEIELRYSQIGEHPNVTNFSQIIKSDRGYVKCVLQAPKNEVVLVDIKLNNKHNLNEYEQYLNDRRSELHLKRIKVPKMAAKIKEMRGSVEVLRTRLHDLECELAATPRNLFVKEVLKIKSSELCTCRKCSAVLRDNIHMNSQRQLVCGSCMLNISSQCRRKRGWQSGDNMFNQLMITCDWPNCHHLTTVRGFLEHRQKCQHRIHPCPMDKCNFQGSSQDLVKHWHMPNVQLFCNDRVTLQKQIYRFYWILRGFGELVKVDVSLQIDDGRQQSLVIRVDEMGTVFPQNYEIKLCSGFRKVAVLEQCLGEKSFTYKITNRFYTLNLSEKKS